MKINIHFNNISLIYSYYNKYFRQSCRKNQDIYLILHTFSPKIVIMWKNMVKPGKADHSWRYGVSPCMLYT